MTSAINTSSLDSSYPTPGVNNSSQGFRDNFTNIKNNLETAKTEIGDLQSKVLVKSALSGTTLDNDMAGGRISNVETLGFRSSMYDLGDNLTGTVTIDCTLGDVQSGTIGSSGAISLAFSKWSPADTYASVDVILNTKAGDRISMADNIKYGADTIEGYHYNGGNPYILVPAGVTRVHYRFSTTDCGTTVEIMPIDQPRIARQVKWGKPATNKGVNGDQQGDVMVNLETSTSYLYVCTADWVTPGTANIWSRTQLGSTSW
jgi:hypothetical protein